ncbi:MAG: BMC domain-containing protein [Lachnospiraceae bacterium]|nr:BMC domain-containing protein [Lachnospiraceae bacterium]
MNTQTTIRTRRELLERIFQRDYEELKGETLRMTRVRIPGKEVSFAHVFTPTDSSIYRNLGLNIGVHEGEDHTGEAIGMIRFTPWEAVVVAADCAMKAARVEIGFMDRFCGSLILTGGNAEVTTAVEEVVRFFRDELHFDVCAVHHS